MRVEPLSVVVVDDHPAVLARVGDWVARSGVAQVVATCQDPNDALRLYAEIQPDVLLCDLQMPVLDGLALTRQVLSLYPKAVVVVFSARPTAETEQACWAAGALGYVPKMASADELRAVLERAAGA